MKLERSKRISLGFDEDNMTPKDIERWAKMEAWLHENDIFYMARDVREIGYFGPSIPLKIELHEDDATLFKLMFPI